MQRICWISRIILLAALAGPAAFAADQTVPGAGNSDAVALARRSPMVQSAYDFLLSQAAKLKDTKLRRETMDALSNPKMCLAHRANLTDAQKNTIVQALISQGLLNPADAVHIQGGAKAGVFPPVLDENTACPQIPQRFFSAPGSASMVGHHSYPGGLAIHEANNDVAAIHWAEGYRAVYGHNGRDGFPTLDREALGSGGHDPGGDSAVFIDEDLVLGPPLWHDWAKTIVYQWNADGSEFTELSFGGTGQNDNFGAAGDSRTGAHHILGVAEEMKRGLNPAFVITAACAHSAPTFGNEYKVVNWLRAAAIVAQIDPIAQGYLYRDSKGNLRLPPLRKLGNDVNLNAAGQPNVLAEYALHNLSDADSVYSAAAIADVNVLLQSIAPRFGINAQDADYLNKFRNPVLSFLTAERLLMIYSQSGIDGVVAEVQKLRNAHIV